MMFNKLIKCSFSKLSLNKKRFFDRDINSSLENISKLEFRIIDLKSEIIELKSEIIELSKKNIELIKKNIKK